MARQAGLGRWARGLLLLTVLSRVSTQLSPPKEMSAVPLTPRCGLGSGLNGGAAQPQKPGATRRGRGAGAEVPTWFLKEVCWTGSSAAREMLLSRMKKRIRLVKMESLTMRWHCRRNLQGSGGGRHTGRGLRSSGPESFCCREATASPPATPCAHPQGLGAAPETFGNPYISHTAVTSSTGFRVRTSFPSLKITAL